MNTQEQVTYLSKVNFEQVTGQILEEFVQDWGFIQPG